MVIIVDREFKKCICLISGLPDLKWFITIYIVLSTQYYTNAKSGYNENANHMGFSSKLTYEN